MDKILVIGIAGGSGSGKTTLMKRLVEQFGDDVTVVSHDNYYRRHDELTYEERSRINYDEPASLETDLMAYHLDCLRNGQAIDCPVYDYTAHNRSDETIRIEPRKVIIERYYDFRKRGSPESDGYPDLRGHRCRCPALPPDQAGCEQAGPYPGICPDPVSGNRKTHARAVCGTQ